MLKSHKNKYFTNEKKTLIISAFFLLYIIEYNCIYRRHRPPPYYYYYYYYHHLKVYIRVLTLLFDFSLTRYPPPSSPLIQSVILRCRSCGEWRRPSAPPSFLDMVLFHLASGSFLVLI